MKTPRDKVQDALHRAQEAPMNKVFTDHKGQKFLGTHSMAWARASREWSEEKEKAQKDSDR